MFYRIGEAHGLPHNPFSAIVSPRPIGWISTRSKDGIDNLSPYSFFNAVCYTPPMVMFSSSTYKDSVTNAEDTGVFCVNMVGHELMDVMNQSAAELPAEVDEFDISGAQKAPCEMIQAPRVANAPAALECETRQVINLGDGSNFMVLGEVVAVHMRDDCLVDGRYDVTRAHHLSRLGYMDYAQISEVFTLKRPR